MSERVHRDDRWVCDDCGAVSDDENAPCSCEDDVADLIAEIKVLRERQRTIIITSAAPRVVRPQRGIAAGQDFLILTGSDRNGPEVTVKIALGCIPPVFDAEYVDTAIEDV